MFMFLLTSVQIVTSACLNARTDAFVPVRLHAAGTASPSLFCCRKKFLVARCVPAGEYGVRFPVMTKSFIAIFSGVLHRDGMLDK